MLPAGVPNEKPSTASLLTVPLGDGALWGESPPDPHALSRTPVSATASSRLRIVSPLTGVIWAMHIFN